LTMTDLDNPSPVFEPATVSRLTFDGPKGPLFKALAEARKHFGPLTTDSTADVANKEGKFLYSFKYAPLDVVLAALAPGLQAAGIALLQPFDGDAMYTIVAFEGSSMTVETPLPNWDTPQQLGSLLTYLRRYQLKGVFGVADSEDDDGNAASGNVAKVERKAPKAPAATVSALPKPLADEVYAAAKAIELPKADFLKRAHESAGKPWVEFTELDAKKLLAELVLKP
jgi:hypothetical protein